jgi:hypothetical protein
MANGSLADQMMRKREHERDRYKRLAAVTFVMGVFCGIGLSVAVWVLPLTDEVHALRLGTESSERVYNECRENLDYWRHEAPEGGGLEWTQCIWALSGCTRERDSLYEDLERYQNMTGWIYEYDPDHRFFMYGWERFDPPVGE